MYLPYKSNSICIPKGYIFYNSQEVKLINIKHAPIVVAYKKETLSAQTHEIRCYGVNHGFPSKPFKTNFVLASIIKVCNSLLQQSFLTFWFLYLYKNFFHCKSCQCYSGNLVTHV